MFKKLAQALLGFVLMFCLYVGNDFPVKMFYTVWLTNLPAEWNTNGAAMTMAGGEVNPGQIHQLPPDWDGAFKEPRFLFQWHDAETGGEKWSLEYLMPPELVEQYDLVCKPSSFEIHEKGEL